MADLAQQVQGAITEALAADELELPVLPEVALNIRTEAERDSVSVNSLAKVIADDASIAAQLIKVVNSPMFRTARVIDELPLAISRLGLDYSANLATGLAMKHMFQATSEFIDTMLRKTWSRSAKVAGLSGLLAKRHTKLRVDQAMVAGLTHSIGVLPILSWAEENDHLLSNSISLERIVTAIHGSIGTMILQRWEFPEEIALVPALHLDHSRYASQPDFIAIVALANRLVQGDEDPDAVPLSEISAFEILDIDPANTDLHASLLEEAAESASNL
ncbi:MAG: HDOD domain-containing protein [Pseudomonadota bacterium]